jgi:guanine deaminase
MTTAASLLITGGQVMRTGADLHHPPVADVLVEGARIARVEPDLAARADIAGGDDVEVIDASGKLVVPGFVNAHYHSHDVLAKGLMEETILEKWRILALPAQYPKRSAAEIRARTLLGALECLRSGMTTVQDMVTLFPFDPAHLETVLQAYRDIGIRSVVALQYGDRRGIDTVPFWREIFPPETHALLSSAAEPDPDFDLLAVLEDDYLKAENAQPRMSWALGPSSPERCSTRLLERTADLSSRYDLPVYTHIYESKAMALQARHECADFDGSLIARLKDIGILGPRLSLAHSVWMLAEEIESVGEAGANVVINPLSNTKLKSGIPPIRELQQIGVNLGLGCDNCSCSDVQNMFQAMKLFCLLAAISDAEPGPPQAEAAFHAATQGGARTALLDSDVGVIEPGFRADLVVLNLMDPTFVPLNSAVRQLVYSEAGRGVETVVVDGRVVLREGRLETMDEAEILREVAELQPGFIEDFNAISARVEALDPYIREAHRRTWAEDVGTNRIFTGQ